MLNASLVMAYGRLLILSIRNWHSEETACALMCLGSWSICGLINNKDIKKVTTLDEVDPKTGDTDDVPMPHTGVDGL